MSEGRPIWGVTSGLKTMADDTVRITIDINPKYFFQACSQFGHRGVEVALARLEQGSTIDYEQQEEKPKKLKGGELSILCARFCQSEEFRKYFSMLTSVYIETEQQCTSEIKRYLAIESRAEIDHKPDVAKLFHKLRKEYVQYQETKEMAR